MIFKGRESRLFLPGQRPHGLLVNQKEKPPDQDGFCEVGAEGLEPRRSRLFLPGQRPHGCLVNQKEKPPN